MLCANFIHETIRTLIEDSPHVQVDIIGQERSLRDPQSSFMKPMLFQNFLHLLVSAKGGKTQLFFWTMHWIFGFNAKTPIFTNKILVLF